MNPYNKTYIISNYLRLIAVCLKMANDTHPTIQSFQYRKDESNSKYRAVFYKTFQRKKHVAVLPDCVLKYVRALYPSPPTK